MSRRQQYLEYWTKLWAQNTHVTSFHVPHVNHTLRSYLGHLGDFKHITLPACGISHDLMWLAQNCHTQVTGIDIAPQVCHKFLEQHGLEPDNETVVYDDQLVAGKYPGVRVRSMTETEGTVEIVIGDFLDETFLQEVFPEQSKTDAIWDRAGVTSMATMEDVELYLKHCYAILKPGGKLLLEFMDSDKQDLDSIRLALGKATYLLGKVGFNDRRTLHTRDLTEEYCNLGAVGATRLDEIVILAEKQSLPC